jgi:hypothetical protein
VDIGVGTHQNIDTLGELLKDSARRESGEARGSHLKSQGEAIKPAAELAEGLKGAALEREFGAQEAHPILEKLEARTEPGLLLTLRVGEGERLDHVDLLTTQRKPPP